jgi:UDP-N-acetylglucosamine transferase subunit ALG13
LIITHGGAGTLLQTLHQGKLIIAVANDELQGNHQLELVSMLGSQNYIKGYASVE